MLAVVDSAAATSLCYGKKGQEGHKLHVDDTTVHRSHIHIGLNWMEAVEQSSFWLHS